MGEPAILDRTRAAVAPALADAIRDLDPNLRLLADYHFGWVDAEGEPTSAAGGKAIRPALAILGAEAVGAPAAAALPGAVAVELIHNFSLIHDDIMDGDRTRRHRRTVWDVFGVGDAIIAGDALHTLAFQVLLGDSGEHRLAACEQLASATAAMIEGQAQDTALDRRIDVTLAECLEMEANKTGALLAHSVGIGSVLGGGDDRQIEGLTEFGRELGVAFQAVDDVLGIWGDPNLTGKPAGNDLRERKKSIPVTIALEQDGPVAADIRLAFEGNLDDATIAALSAELAANGVRARVDELAATHLDAALTALGGISVDDRAAAELEGLARFVVSREH